MVPSAGHRVPIPGRSFRVTQGVSSPGAASLLLGTSPFSRTQGLHPRASFPPAGHRVPLPGCSIPSAGQRSSPGIQGPLPGAQVPSARQTVHFPGATSTPMGTGPLPGVEGPLRGHSLLSEGRTLGSPRRSASHADAAPPGADKPSWAQPPPAAQRIREDAARPPRATRGCASHPAARRGPGAGIYRVWGRWSGPQPPALRGLSHLPRAYINAAALVSVALPRVTLRPRAADVWFWALRRAWLAPRPRPGAPSRRLSLSHLSLSRCLSLCLNLSAGGSAPLARPAPAAAAARARSCRGGASTRRRRARARASGPRTGVPTRLRRESRDVASRTKSHLVSPGRLEGEGASVGHALRRSTARDSRTCSEETRESGSLKRKGSEGDRWDQRP